MKMSIFWVLAPCSLVEVYRRVRGASCLHHQDYVSWSADEDSIEAQCDILPTKSSTLTHVCQAVTESDDEPRVTHF
jgi:hypothetical protein